MFVGEFEATVQSNGRVQLPAPFHDSLAGSSAALAIERASPEAGSSYYLALKTGESFEAERLDVLEHQREGGLNSIQDFDDHWRPLRVSNDRRITIPAAYRRLMQIDQDSPLVISGAINRLEIWDPAAWAAERAAVEHTRTSDDEPPAARPVRRSVEGVAIDESRLESALDNPALIAGWVDEVDSGPDDAAPLEVTRSVEAILLRVTRMLDEAKLSSAEDDLTLQLTRTIREELSGRHQPPRWKVLRLLLSILLTLCLGVVADAIWELWGQDLLELIGLVFD